MKAIKITLAIAFYILIIYNVFAIDKTYCDGWEKGYKAGFCHEIVNCIKPIVPVCPVPKVGFNTYKDGYNRGFVKALKDRKNDK